MHTPSLLVLAVLITGCFSPTQELEHESAAASELQKAASSPRPVSACSDTGARLPGLDETGARQQLQGRWLRCGATGRIEEASTFAREAPAFEVDGDRWFELEQLAGGTWVRVAGSEGTLSWWTTNEAGVTFHSSEGMDPALVEVRSGGVRLEFYPGASVVYAPLE